MVEAFRFTVRTWLDDATRYWPSGAKEVVSAESLYQQALAAQAAGDHKKALDLLKDVFKAARP